MNVDFDNLVRYLQENYDHEEIKSSDVAGITEISQSWWSGAYLTNHADETLQVIDEKHPLYGQITALVREWAGTDDTYFERTRWVKGDE